MQISPKVSANSAVNTMNQDGSTGIRKTVIKMNTNANTGQLTPEEEEAIGLRPAEKLTIDDPNKSTTEASEDAKPLSPQLAELARRRRALQVQERALADREKALAEKTSSQGETITLAQLKSNPLGTLLDSGVTYDQLSEAILANQNGQTPQIVSLQNEIKSLKEGLDKTLSDRTSQEEKAALSEMKRQATSLIAQGDTYALVRETNSVPTVMKLIETHYRRTGDVIPVEEALQFVESEKQKEAVKIAALDKVQSELRPAQPALQPQQQRQMRTLSNKDTATTVPLSKRARAMAAFYGTLKK